MRLLKDTPFEAAWLVWEPRHREHALTVAVKASYELPATGAATLCSEQELLTGDLYVDDDVEKGLRWASDLEPLKPCGEAFVVGSFQAPGGQSVERSLAAFAVGDIKKAVAVTGDRVRKRGATPTPFSTMPLSWERSYGGPSHEANPVGRGIAPDLDTGEVILPNVEDPQATLEGGAPQAKTWGIGPMPKGFRARRQHAGTYDERWLQTRYPGYADDLDYRLFLAAPEDQRAPGYFDGNEIIELRNLHPKHPELRCWLPGDRAQAFVSRAGVLTDVGLRLDTIAIDADRGRASLVWRGVLPVPDPALADIDHLFVVHQLRNDRHSLDHYTRWFQRVLDAEKDPEAEAQPTPPAASAPSAPSAQAPSAEAMFDQDPSMTLRSDAGLSAAIAAELARRGDAIGAAAFRPVFEDALGLPERANEELSPEELRQLEMSGALEGFIEAEPEPAVDPRRDRVRDAIRAGESCAKWDLADVDLSGLDLGGGDFTGAILARANLGRVHAAGARFDGATLTRADLTEGSFQDTSFEGADLSMATAEMARFAGCRFDHVTGPECYLREARFARCTFAQSELVDCDLGDTLFDECRLDGADLSGSFLERARFARCTLVDAWLERVQAQHSVFDGCDASLLRASEEADFEHASFKRANLDGARFSTSRLRRAGFGGATLRRADFREAMLAEASFLGCVMQKAKLDGAALAQASLMKSDLFQASFAGANLAGADLRGANLFQAELLGANVEGARLDLAVLDGTRLA